VEHAVINTTKMRVNRHPSVVLPNSQYNVVIQTRDAIQDGTTIPNRIREFGVAVNADGIRNSIDGCCVYDNCWTTALVKNATSLVC